MNYSTAANEGYRAQAQGKVMTLDNPYRVGDPRHNEWRSGFIDAWNDSNGDTLPPLVSISTFN